MISNQPRVPPKMTAKILRRIGTALYGKQWIRPMGRDLDVSEGTIRNWLKFCSVPQYAKDKLVDIIDERIEEVTKVLDYV